MAVVATRASFAGITFWAESISGTQPRDIVEHRSFGRTGADTEDTGAPSRHDTINARMDYDDYIVFYKVVHEAKPRLFVHPILGSWLARASIDSETISAKKPGKVEFSVSFVEDETAALATPEASQSVGSYQQELASIFSDADECVYDD